MKIASIYNVASGQIRTILMVPTQEDVDLNTREGEAAIEGEWMPNEWYIVDGTPVQRPEPGISVPGPGPHPTGSLIRFEDIPPGSQVLCPNGVVEVDDGFLEWGTVEPGVYTFRFITFPMQESEYHAEFAAV